VSRRCTSGLGSTSRVTRSARTARHDARHVRAAGRRARASPYHRPCALGRLSWRPRAGSAASAWGAREQLESALPPNSPPPTCGAIAARLGGGRRVLRYLTGARSRSTCPGRACYGFSGACGDRASHPLRRTAPTRDHAAVAKPSATRAWRAPVPEPRALVIPCHRVVGRRRLWLPAGESRASVPLWYRSGSPRRTSVVLATRPLVARLRGPSTFRDDALFPVVPRGRDVRGARSRPARPAQWDELEAIVARAVARSRAVQRQLALFLTLLEWLPLLRYARPLSRLDPARRAKSRPAATRPLLLVRRGFWGVRTLILMGYYGRPRRGGHRLSGRTARLGGEAVSVSPSYDIVVIGSGAGGGTVAQELARWCVTACAFSCSRRARASRIRTSPVASSRWPTRCIRTAARS